MSINDPLENINELETNIKELAKYNEETNNSDYEFQNENGNNNYNNIKNTNKINKSNLTQVAQ